MPVYLLMLSLRHAADMLQHAAMSLRYMLMLTLPLTLLR